MGNGKKKREENNLKGSGGQSAIDLLVTVAVPFLVPFVQSQERAASFKIFTFADYKRIVEFVVFRHQNDIWNYLVV